MPTKKTNLNYNNGGTTTILIDDLLSSCFINLSLKDIRNTSLVCKQFKRVVDNLWKILCGRDYQILENWPLISWLDRYKIERSCSWDINDSVSGALFTNNNKTLSFYGSTTRNIP